MGRFGDMKCERFKQDPDLFGVLVPDQLQLSTAFSLQTFDQLSVETVEPTVPTLEPHAITSVGISTYLSRAISAP